MKLRVIEARMLNPLVRLVRLRPQDGQTLPGYTPGAHMAVRVQLPTGRSDWRQYSLVNFSADPQATAAPAEYVIAVRREDSGRGGSRFLHEELRQGALLEVQAPKNDFPLQEHAGAAVLVAGGIGITPLATMAAARRATGQPVRMVYAGRSLEQMAFLPELRELLGQHLQVHEDASAGAPMDVDALLDTCGPQDHLYVCGPRQMLDAILASTQARGWPRERVHFELFTAAAAAMGDRSFDIVLAQSGRTLTVPADKTILACLIEHGVDPLYDCLRGECGVCAVPVLEGEIDHRDYVLSEREKAAGNVIQTCISRCRGQRIVLDL